MNLRALNNADIDGMLEWMRDPTINQYFLFDASAQTEKTVEAFINNSMSVTNKHYAVVNDEDCYQGTISLKQIDYENQTAEYAISLRKCSIGTGVATFATKALLQKAFYELNLNRVYLNVLSENLRAQKFYEKIGFKYEGEFVSHVKKGQAYKNLKWYAILKQEYEALI